MRLKLKLLPSFKQVVKNQSWEKRREESKKIKDKRQVHSKSHSLTE